MSRMPRGFTKAAQACSEEQEKKRKENAQKLFFVISVCVTCSLKAAVETEKAGECIYKPLSGIKVREIRGGRQSARMKSRQI